MFSAAAFNSAFNPAINPFPLRIDPRPSWRLRIFLTLGHALAGGVAVLGLDRAPPWVGMLLLFVVLGSWVLASRQAQRATEPVNLFLGGRLERNVQVYHARAQVIWSWAIALQLTPEQGSAGVRADRIWLFRDQLSPPQWRTLQLWARHGGAQAVPSDAVVGPSVNSSTE